MFRVYTCDPWREEVGDADTLEKAVVLALETFDGPEYPRRVCVEVRRLRRDGETPDMRYRARYFELDYAFYTADEIRIDS